MMKLFVQKRLLATRRGHGIFTSACNMTATESDAGDEKVTKKKSSVKKNIESPELTKLRANQIENILTLNVSYNLITWMLVNKEGSILDWRAVKSQASKKALKTTIFENDFKYIKGVFEKNIPQTCQAYVFESRTFKTFDAKLVPLMIRISRDELILQCVIKSFVDSNAGIYTLNRSYVGNKYRILVGNERTMSNEIVHQILRRDTSNFEMNEDNKNELDSLALNESEVFRRFFYDCREQAVKESLSENYLQASCFVKKLKYVKYFAEQKSEADE